jgi:hypothetical protein
MDCSSGCQLSRIAPSTGHTLKHAPQGKQATDYFPTGYEELAERFLGTIFDTEGHKGVFNFLVAANQHKIKELAVHVAGKPLK